MKTLLLSVVAVAASLWFSGCASSGSVSTADSTVDHTVTTSTGIY